MSLPMKAKGRFSPSACQQDATRTQKVLGGACTVSRSEVARRESKHDDPGCFDSVFFQWVKDDLAGRPQHIERLGISYMYMGQWVPGVSGGEFHVGPYIMVVTPHPEDLKGFTKGGWNGTYIIHLPGTDQADKWFLAIPIHQADKQ